MPSEEEIIKTIKNFDKETKKVKEERSPYDEIKFKKILIYLSEEHYSIFADLLDLYEKEKEKNKKYEEGIILSDKQANMVFQAIKEGATEQITKEMKNYIHKDKIREKLLNPVQEEGEKINKEFFKKDKGHFVESFCVEGAILQELGAIEEMILELLEESE